MLCSDTDTSVPAVKIGLPMAVARDISYWLEAIRQTKAKGRITLFVSSEGDIVDSEVTVKPPHKKKLA